MSPDVQSTFRAIAVREGDYAETCKKIMDVKDGERIYCNNGAKYKINRPYDNNDYRCGMHIADYSELLEING